MITNDHSAKFYKYLYLFLLVCSFLFRLWFITTIPLSGDESYHWEWSRHLAFGYYDHPGLTAYLIRFSTWLFQSSTEFTVRLPAVIMLTGTSIVCYLLAKRVTRDNGGSEQEAEHSALLAGILIIIIPIFAAFSVYISTDPPLIFFWTLTLYFLYRAFHEKSWGLWICSGMAMGLTMLSKFLAFFMGPAVLIFILLSKENRRWLKKPHGYVAIISALLVFSPFLYWNATHQWATFMFNFVYRKEVGPLSIFYPSEFVLGQAIALSPIIFIFILSTLYKAIKFSGKTEKQFALFFAMTTLMPFLYFFYVSIHRRIGLHWPTIAWIGSIIYMAYYWTTCTASKTILRFRKAAFLLCILITVTIHLLIHIPPEWLNSTSWSYFGSPSRINLKQHKERFGWKDLGQWVHDVRKEMLTGQKKNKGVFVISSQYGLSSNIAFYTPNQIKTHLWRTSRKVHGENYKFWDNFSSLKHMDAIFVTKREKKARNTITSLKKHFKRVGEPERLPIIIGEREIRSFFIVRCYGFDGINPEES